MIPYCRNLNSSFVKCVILNKQLSTGLRRIRLIYTSTSCLATSNETPSNRKSITVNTGEKQISDHVKVTERIKQTTKDVTNISVILIGFGITCFIFYAVFKEFFSSKSPSTVFSHALKKCKNDPRVTEALGTPIKGHGEMTTRRRARHVSFVEYDNNGKTYLRVKFYLRGSKTSATVHCETDKSSPRSEFRYLFVELDTFPHKVIIIEDNRLLDS